MQKFGIIVLFVGILTSCSNSHPQYMSVQKQTVEVDGSRFDVRIKGDMAEAIRTNFEYAPKIGEIFPKAARAMEMASGCKVVPNSMKGDPALMVANLKCD